MMINGKHVFLKDVDCKSDYLFIYETFNLDDLYLWNNKNENITYDSFVNEINYLFNNEYKSFKIICENNTNEKVGFVFSYRVRKWDSHAFITLYISDKYRKTILSIESAILYVKHIFEDLKINKVFFEVYEYNVYSIDVMAFPGVIKEATLKEYRKYNNKYYDLFIYSITKEKFFKNEKILEAIKND